MPYGESFRNSVKCISMLRHFLCTSLQCSQARIIMYSLMRGRQHLCVDTTGTVLQLPVYDRRRCGGVTHWDIKVRHLALQWIEDKISAAPGDD